MKKLVLILLPLIVLIGACKKDSLSSEEDHISPQVINSQPVDGATDANISSEVYIEYDEDIKLSAYQVIVNGEERSVTRSGRKLLINVSLIYNTTYNINISDSSVTDEAGNFADAFSFSFTTTSPPPFNIDPTLTTPTPSTQATNVYNFLKESFQQKIISGTMAAHSTNIDEATWVHEQTGKWPALTGFDFIDHTWLDQNWVEYNAPYTLGSDWWLNNGLITISWHWRDPLTKSGAFYTNETTFDVSKITDPSSDEYAAMIEDIDTIAGYLREFKDANIPVLWRPLHEAAGGWFWWGAKGAAPCKALWQLMYDRMVNYHGLNNLIWVWTTNTSSDALDWYPGHDYVDIISMDIYPGENQHGSQYIEFDKVKEIFEARKIITLSECGSVPDPASMMEYGDTWSWFMPWNGDFTRSDNHNGVAWWNTFFGYDYVITRDLMPDLK
jgi:mannan endo-1,4-beta-mannosidase